jgi:hypothetical protein
MIGQLLNDELERIWEEVAMALFVCRGWGRSPEIQTKHLSNTSLEHYCYMNPLTGPDEGNNHFRISDLVGLQI